MTLLTTTVSVDAQRNDYSQVTINLVQGDVGTRRFQMIPISGGQPISLADLEYARVQALSVNQEPLLVNCAVENGKIYLEPPAALVEYQKEWQCQLELKYNGNSTLTSMKFTIIVHGKLYTGDAVEHTNETVTSVEWDEETLTLTINRADGTAIYCGPMDHTHDNATADADGFMAKEDKAALDEVAGYVDQGVKTTSSPEFANLTIGVVSIDGTTGVVTGLRFT